MRILLLLLIIGMIVLSACGEKMTIPEVSDPPVTENRPVVEQPDDYTDIQTAEDDFEALDETLDELE